MFETRPLTILSTHKKPQSNLVKTLQIQEPKKPAPPATKTRRPSKETPYLTSYLNDPNSITYYVAPAK